VFEREKPVHALDREATVMGLKLFSVSKNKGNSAE
jgi:hypothetical protein